MSAANASEFASGIQGARLKVLDGHNHILVANEPAWPRFLDELDAVITVN